MATTHPELLDELTTAPREPQHTDVAAIQEENRRLRQLVIQLSKLVVKYVMRQN
jgi:hypothetical protein